VLVVISIANIINGERSHGMRETAWCGAVGVPLPRARLALGMDIGS
jgi:hypothetical protein